MMRSRIITDPGYYEICQGYNELVAIELTGSIPNSFNLLSTDIPCIFLKSPTSRSLFLPLKLNSSKTWFQTYFNLSQEEIDALMKELEEAKIHALNYNGAAPVPIEFEPNGNIADPWYFGTVYEPKTDKAKCFHKWKLYTGLVEQFEYCEICGDKK